MKTRWMSVCGFTLVAATPAWSQRPVDAETIKLYSGDYSSACGNPAALQLHVGADALTVAQGATRITGRNVQSFYSLFGQSPPPNYQVALVADVSDGVSLMFIVYRDESGRYITIDGHPKVTSALGTTTLAGKYRQCGAATGQAAAAPAVPPPAEDIALPATLLKDARFTAAFRSALRFQTKRPDWLTKLDGPGSPLDTITIDGKEYVVASVCKDHDCGDNNAVLLYSAADARVFGKILEERRPILIGAPPQPIAAALERLWAAQWRK